MLPDFLGLNSVSPSTDLNCVASYLVFVRLSGLAQLFPGLPNSVGSRDFAALGCSAFPHASYWFQVALIPLVVAGFGPIRVAADEALTRLGLCHT